MTTTTAPTRDLLRGAAHLLRTPLGVILGMTTTLRDYDARFTADQRVMYLGEVLQAAEEMRDALDGLSLLSRLLTGDLAVIPAVITADTLLSESAAALGSVWGARGVPRRAAAAGAVTADSGRIRQALQALARAVAPLDGTALSVDADGTLRIGPVQPRGTIDELRGVLDGPLNALDTGTLAARPGTWGPLLARYLVEAQGGRLGADGEPAGAVPSVTITVTLPTSRS